jgi:hypothetical protein
MTVGDTPRLVAFKWIAFPYIYVTSEQSYPSHYSMAYFELSFQTVNLV